MTAVSVDLLIGILRERARRAFCTWSQLSIDNAVMVPSTLIECPFETRKGKLVSIQAPEQQMCVDRLQGGAEGAKREEGRNPTWIA